MNKQRKVLITITYNEMGIIIDTKAEEVTQPNLQPTCNQLATDCISRQDAIDALAEWEATRVWDDWCYDHKNEAEKYHITAPSAVVKALPPAQPHTDAEIQKMQELESAQVERAYELGRESVQPTGTWLIHKWGDDAKCSNCGKTFKDIYDMDNYDNFCRHCGTHMKGIRAI